MSSSTDFLKNFEVLASEGQHYTTFRLKDNGLKVTVVGCETPFNSVHSQVIYHVGSADEKVGYSGSTHLLEHLLFKSSANPAVKNIFEVMEPAGATINATTSFDRTNFYCTYAANFLPRWCKAEAMRMETAPFSEEFDAKEKQVVQDELRIGLDNPFQRLRSHVMNTAFNRSGYAVDTGGYMRDVAQVSFDRLKKFHKDFYGPNNAHIVVVGAVSPKFVLRHVYNNFSKISNEGRVPDRTDRLEEPQRGARQVAVNVESPVCMLMMSYRNMEGRHRGQYCVGGHCLLPEAPFCGGHGPAERHGRRPTKPCRERSSEEPFPLQHCQFVNLRPSANPAGRCGNDPCRSSETKKRTKLTKVC